MQAKVTVMPRCATALKSGFVTGKTKALRQVRLDEDSGHRLILSQCVGQMADAPDHAKFTPTNRCARPVPNCPPLWLLQVGPFPPDHMEPR